MTIDRRYAAALRFRDAPRAESLSFVKHLGPKHQFQRVMIVSGDRESEVRYLAEQVGITEIHAQKSPEEKLAIVRAHGRRPDHAHEVRVRPDQKRDERPDLRVQLEAPRIHEHSLPWVSASVARFAHSVRPSSWRSGRARPKPQLEKKWKVKRATVYTKTARPRPM